MRLIISVFLFLVITDLSAQTQKISSTELESWQSIGQGNGFVTHGQFFMEELEGSQGFMILSPEKYEDVVLRYEVITLNPATVLVAILNASDIGNSNSLTLKENSDTFSFWAKSVQDYMFAFRTQAHNSTPFLRKYPGMPEEKKQLALAEKDIMHSGWRHKIECGKKGNYLWLKIDEETIFDATDTTPLNAGKIALRVRGTASELGKCMIRNLEIEGQPVE
jgi:hypothetical protein